MSKKWLIFLSILMILPFILYFSLAAKYKYDVTQNYQYALNTSTYQEIKTELKQGNIQFTSPQAWDTGFIRLKVKSTLTGYFAEPFIEIIIAKHHSILTLERGVSGERYINLPVALTNQPISIKLLAHHLILRDQQTSIILFNNPIVRKHPKILVIAPHPDDAEIAAFNFYSQHDSLIVTLTAGEAGSHRYEDIYSDIKKQYQNEGKLRVWNSITVPMLGGIPPEHAINLGYFDSTLSQMFAHKNTAVNSLYTGITDVNSFRKQNISSLTPSTDGAATWTALVNDLKSILFRFQPNIIISPYPALDWHEDHKLASLALIEAIKELQLQQGQLFLYTNHLTFNNYFPYGNQGELAPIPPDFHKALYFDSIYSFSTTDFKEKIFALDAMNDLRLDTRWLSSTGALNIFKKSFFRNILLRDQTYFRRAVRENELFFVINFSSLYKEKIFEESKIIDFLYKN